MNIVYRIVWNRAKGEWTAVSELTKGHGRELGGADGHEHTRAHLAWAIACVLGSIVMGVPMAHAGNPVGQQRQTLQKVSPRLADLSDLLVKYGNAQPAVVRKVAPQAVAVAVAHRVPVSSRKVPRHVVRDRIAAAPEVAPRDTYRAAPLRLRTTSHTKQQPATQPLQKVHSPQLATNAQIAAVVAHRTQGQASDARAVSRNGKAGTAGTWVVGRNGSLHVMGEQHSTQASVANVSQRAEVKSAHSVAATHEARIATVNLALPEVVLSPSAINVTPPRGSITHAMQFATRFSMSTQSAVLASVKAVAPKAASLPMVNLTAPNVGVTPPRAGLSMASISVAPAENLAKVQVVQSSGSLPPVPVPQSPQPTADDEQLAIVVSPVHTHSDVTAQTSGLVLGDAAVGNEPLLASVVAGQGGVMASHPTYSSDSSNTQVEQAATTATSSVATTSLDSSDANTTDNEGTNSGTEFAAAAFGSPQLYAPAAVTPMALPAGDSRIPPAPETPTPGLIIGTGGLIGAVGGTLNPVTGALLDPNDPYLESGALKLAKANITTAYSGGVTLTVLGLPVTVPVSVVNTLSAASGATVGTGENQHLTLLGGVTSDSYITNINNGATNGGIINSSDPAWSENCVNVNILGLVGVTVPCWGVNAAQNNQVVIGDGAYANGSEEVVIGTGASHKLADVDANTAFPGDGNRNSTTDPMGLPNDDYQSRLGHSVVIGDSASGTQTEQTIIGANATSDKANSVALGYGSNADRGALPAGYTNAYGLIGTPQTSAGEVAVGNAGHARQITHVAAGTDDHDAVNVLQLEGAMATAGNGSVKYDTNPDTSINYNSVTLQGTSSTDGGVTGGTSITNLHQGVIGATSTDAVNGSQLNATNTTVANYFGGTTNFTGGVWTGPQFTIHNITDKGAVTSNTYDNVSDAFSHLDTSVVNVNTRVSNIYDTGVKYFHTKSTLGDSTPTGTNSIAIGPVAVASETDTIAIGNGANASKANSIALGAGSATAVGALTGYTGYALKPPQTSVGEVNVGNRQVTGVAAGSADDDAVNVAQLRAVDQSQKKLSDRALKYDLDGAGGVNYASATLAGTMSTDGGVTGGTTITNLHQGALGKTSTDAVNGAQIYATNNTIASYFGGQTTFNGTTWVKPDFSIVQIDTTGNVTTGHFDNVTDAFNALDTSLINIMNNTALDMKYFKANSTGPAAAASGKDSVAMGGSAVAKGDGSVAAGSGAQANGTGAVAIGQGASSTATGGVALGAGSVASRNGGGVEAFTKTAVPTEGAVSVGSSGHERQITNVAGGTAATDAVNLRQLQAVATMINTVSSKAVMYDDASKQTVTLNPGGQSSLLTNLAPGAVTATSLDAINGSQLFGWTQDITNKYSNYSLYKLIKGNNGKPNSGAVNPYLAVNNTSTLPPAQATGKNSVAAGAGAVASGDNSAALGNGAKASGNGSVALGNGSQATRANVVSVGSSGHERQISNVAGGTADTDAVNVAQLKASVVQTQNWTKTYVDNRYNMIDRQLNALGDNAYAGIASAMAMAELPSAYAPGKSMVSVAAGTFHGQSSLAVGVSLISDNGRWVFKLGGSTDTQGDAGGAVGVGIQW